MLRRISPAVVGKSPLNPRVIPRVSHSPRRFRQPASALPPAPYAAAWANLRAGPRLVRAHRVPGRGQSTWNGGDYPDGLSPLSSSYESPGEAAESSGVS